MTSVRASFNSIRGRIESAWTLEAGTFRWSVRIPANTTATATLPDGTVHTLGSGSYEFVCPC